VTDILGYPKSVPYLLVSIEQVIRHGHVAVHLNVNQDYVCPNAERIDQIPRLGRIAPDLELEGMAAHCIQVFFLVETLL
jgi:hypothetical protein